MGTMSDHQSNKTLPLILSWHETFLQRKSKLCTLRRALLGRSGRAEETFRTERDDLINIRNILSLVQEQVAKHHLSLDIHEESEIDDAVLDCIISYVNTLFGVGTQSTYFEEHIMKLKEQVKTTNEFNKRLKEEIDFLEIQLIQNHRREKLQTQQFFQISSDCDQNSRTGDQYDENHVYSKLAQVCLKDLPEDTTGLIQKHVIFQSNVVGSRAA